MFSISSESFIEKQIYLHNLSINPRYAIYAPIGLPFLIGVTSIFTNFYVYLIKLLEPISLLIGAVFLKKNNFEKILLFNYIIYNSPFNYGLIHRHSWRNKDGRLQKGKG